MQHFRECSWDVVLREADVNRAYDAFNGVIRSRLDLIFPEKTRAKKICVTVAWITRGIRVSCKNKRVLYEEVRSGWFSEEYYKKFVKVLKQVIEKAKIISNQSFMSGAKNRVKATWSLIKQITDQRIGMPLYCFRIGLRKIY
ncbi:hypothetical protein HHI36_000504 [Cryptolaemus montrouzieri]|uniref:Reverse transcriptase n=1 Tax=Cryptolaemus montrouzieri TaxID=559131 RepID=A0ABD2P579_9CUCU